MVSYEGACMLIKYKGGTPRATAQTVDVAIASCLSVTRGDYLRTTFVGSMQSACPLSEIEN